MFGLSWFSAYLICALLVCICVIVYAITLQKRINYNVYEILLMICVVFLISLPIQAIILFMVRDSQIRIDLREASHLAHSLILINSTSEDVVLYRVREESLTLSKTHNIVLFPGDQIEFKSCNRKQHDCDVVYGGFYVLSEYNVAGYSEDEIKHLESLDDKDLKRLLDIRDKYDRCVKSEN